MENYTYKNEEGRNAFMWAVWERHHQSLRLYASRVCARFGSSISDSDDAMQEFYHKLLVNHEFIAVKYREHGLRYLMTIIRNEIFGIERKRKSMERISEVYTQPIPLSVDISHYSLEPHLEDVLKTAAKWLSEQDVNILKYYLEGYTHHEIGEKLQMNPRTIGVRIHRMKKTLKSHMT